MRFGIRRGLRALGRRFGRSASAVRIYMGRTGGATEVVKKLADGWHYRLYEGSPWVGPFENKGFAVRRRDLALTRRDS